MGDDSEELVSAMENFARELRREEAQHTKNEQQRGKVQGKGIGNGRGKRWIGALLLLVAAFAIVALLWNFSSQINWTATATVAVAVFTAVLVFVAYAQWRTSQGTYEADNRAWVLVNRVDLDGVRCVTGSIGPYVCAKLAPFNYGNGPAFDVRVTYSYTVCDSDDPDASELNPHIPLPSRSIIGPGQDSQTVVLVGDTPDRGVRDELAANTKWLILDGVILYRDQVSKSRTTEFRCYWKASTHAVGICRRGNAAS